MQVLSKVTNETPSPALVDAYLTEIARGYNLDWTPPAPPNLLNPPPSASDILNLANLSEVILGRLSVRSACTHTAETRKTDRKRHLKLLRKDRHQSRKKTLSCHQVCPP